MIGYRRKFVFIHIPKTAGQSVTKALWPHALTPHQRPLQWIARRLGRRVKYDLYGVFPNLGHATARESRDFMGRDLYEAYYSFAFVRNPWDRMVSLRSFTRLRPRLPLHRAAMSPDLIDFIRAVERAGLKQQIDYITDEDGNVMVDFVGRFETLAEDFARVSAGIGIETRLPHKNRSSHADYRSLYGNEERDLIARIWADDIRELGYTFE